MHASHQLSISLASMCRTWSCPPKNTAKVQTVSFSSSTPGPVDRTIDAQVPQTRQDVVMAFTPVRRDQQAVSG